MNAGIEIASIAMFFISFYILISSKNAIKSVVAIVVMEISVVMFFLSLGFLPGMTPPLGVDLAYAADPLPQALVITTIIIGVTVSAVNLAMLISFYRQFKTADWGVVIMKIKEGNGIDTGSDSNSILQQPSEVL